MGVNVTSNQIGDDNNSERRSLDDQNNSPRRSITPSTPGDKFSTKVGLYAVIISLPINENILLKIMQNKYTETEIHIVFLNIKLFNLNIIYHITKHP